MKVGLISMRPKIGKVKSNIEKMEKYINKKKADIYIFGETNLTGYPLKDELRDYAEKIDGENVKYIQRIAKKTGSYIVFGTPTRDPDIKGLIHNSSVFIHPDGKIDTYDKWFLVNFGPFEEKFFYDEGEKLKIINTKFGKIGLIICYDLYFPELCKAYALQGADMIICISASPSVTRYYFETILPARAIENTVFMLYSNIVGSQEELVFWGGSQAYDPLGKQIIKAPYFKESIVTCDINNDIIETARANRSVLRDIRPDIYNDLYHFSRYHKNNTKK